MKKKGIEVAKGDYLNYQWMVIRNLDRGFPCGYVRLYDKHPLDYLVEDENYDAIDVECHGGLTFAKRVRTSKELPPFTPGYWIGWDYAHAGDWVAFSSNMFNVDIGDRRWTDDEVVQECHDVIRQLTEKYK